MQNNKFFDTLRTLNKKELAAFTKYLRGNYGNVKIALAVFDYVRAFSPDYRDEKKLNIAYAYKKIFGADINENDYNRFKLLNTLSDLDKWLKEFLLWEKVKGESLESQALWLSIAKERGLADESEKQLNKIRLGILSSNKKGAGDLLKGLLVNYYAYYHKQDKKSVPNTDVLMQHIHDLDNYFAITRMKATCELANLHKVQILPIQPEIWSVIQDIAEWPHIQAQPLFQIYKEAYALITKEDPTAYTTIESWMYENHPNIDKEDLHILLSYVHNFVATKCKLNETAYMPVLHRLNRFAVEYGFFIEKDAMSPTQFNNIINVACNQKDYDWASHFIDTHGNLLQEKQRVDTINLAKATVLFNQKEFEKSYNALKDVNFASLEHEILSKIFIIRCLFELPLGQSIFDNTCETFEAFLRRKQKARPTIVQPSLNFLRLIRLIYEEKTPRDKLIEKIKTTEPLYVQEWLLEKMIKYKGKFAAQKHKGL